MMFAAHAVREVVLWQHVVIRFRINVLIHIVSSLSGLLRARTDHANLETPMLNEPRFGFRVQRIGNGDFEWIVKNRKRLAEFDAMFEKVRDCLSGVPFDSIFQSYCNLRWTDNLSKTNVWPGYPQT